MGSVLEGKENSGEKKYWGYANLGVGGVPALPKYASGLKNQ